MHVSPLVALDLRAAGNLLMAGNLGTYRVTGARRDVTAVEAYDSSAWGVFRVNFRFAVDRSRSTEQARRYQ